MFVISCVYIYKLYAIAGAVTSSQQLHPRHIIAPNSPVATISSPKTSRQLETKAS